MAKICGIYSITNTVNGKKTIGQSKNILNRWQNHKWLLKTGSHPNLHLQAAWNKYGSENFIFEIILECPERALDDEEVRLMTHFKVLDRKYGYNLRSGGMRYSHSEETKKRMSDLKKGKPGHKHTAETKKKLSDAKRGKPGHTQSSQTRMKISLAFSGAKNHNFGKPLSEETKQKIRAAELGKVISNATRDKMSRSKMGHSVSEETINKISNALMGNTNGSKQKVNQQTLPT